MTILESEVAMKMRPQSEETRIYIESVLGFAKQWRELGAEEWLSDENYTSAVRCLARLEADVSRISDDVLLRFETVWQADEEVLVGIWREKLHQVGFEFIPISATALVEGVLLEAEERIKRNRACALPVDRGFLKLGLFRSYVDALATIARRKLRPLAGANSTHAM